MNLQTRTLYQITFIFLGTLIVIAGGLLIYQDHVVAHRPKQAEKAPFVSPHQQLEFESGQLRRQHESEVAP